MSNNIRELTVYTGVSQTSAVAWVGKVYLSWVPGMNLEAPNYQFQIRRNHLQDIQSENIWWASECVYHAPATSMDSGSSYTQTSAMLFNQNRSLGHERRHFDGQLDLVQGVWTGGGPSAQEAYYYAIGLTNTETGELVEFSACSDRVYTPTYSSQVGANNQGATEGAKILIRRPSRRLSVNNSHVYWLGIAGQNQCEYGDPAVYNCDIVMQSAADPIGRSDFYCCGQSASDQDWECSAWQPSTCTNHPEEGHLLGNCVCPSIAASAAPQTNGAIIGCDEWCAYPNNMSCCVECPPGDIVHIAGTIGEWRVSWYNGNAQGFDYLGMDPSRDRDEGGYTYELSRGWQGFSLDPVHKPISWTSQAQGVYGPDGTDDEYAWYGSDLSDEGIMWSNAEAWVLGAQQRNKFSYFWESNGIIDTGGVTGGTVYDAFGHWAQIGSQRASIIDLDYRLFNWDSNNLTDENPWKDKIEQEIAPFDDTLDIDAMFPTHCGVKLRFTGELLSAIGAEDSFNFADCYVRIDRKKGWDINELDDYVPVDPDTGATLGWDVDPSTGVTVNTFRNDFNYGKVYDSRPSGNPVGNLIDTDGTLINETGKTISDCISTWNADGLGQPTGSTGWQINLPVQPNGTWSYRVRIYEGESGEENKVWDSNYHLGLNYGVNVVQGCGLCNVDEDEVDWWLVRNWSPKNDNYWLSLETTDYWADPKFMWKDYNAGAGYNVPKFGDILVQHDAMYYLRGSNQLVLKGGATVSVGQSSVHFDLLFGEGHDDLMDEGVDGIPINYTTNPNDSVPGFAASNTGLSNGDVTFSFDLCNVPEDGNYVVSYTIICDDTGNVQKSEQIPIIVDHAAPTINEDNNFSELLDGLTLNYGFSAADANGLAYMNAMPQTYEVDGHVYAEKAPYLLCHECYFLDSGDIENAPLSNLQFHTLECETTLTAQEVARCICNGSFYMYAYAADYAGNCEVRRFTANVSGAVRGIHPSGTCNAPSAAGGPGGLSLQDPIWFNPETNGIEIYTEMNCCIDSGGSWDFTTDTCTSWGNPDGHGVWDWQEGICLDCLDNPIEQYSGAAAQIHRVEADCIAYADPTCATELGVWSESENTEAEDCTAVEQEGFISVDYGMAITPAHEDWGLAANLPMGAFLNYFGCCDCGDGTQSYSCCNLSCVVDVEASCDDSEGQISNLTWNLIGPYMNNAGHPIITMLITDVPWEYGWNTTCGEQAVCKICFCIPENCCGDKPKTKKCHCGIVSFSSHVLNGGCCQVCPADDTISTADVVTEIGQNVALYYTPSLDRWDAVDVAPAEMSGDDIVFSPRVGAVALGKFGEQIVSIDDNLVGFTEKKEERRKWLWHSKDLHMGNDSSIKIFKKVKVRANLHFSWEIESTGNPIEGVHFSDNPVVVLVDGKEADLTLDFDSADIPSIPSYDNKSEKTFYNFVYKLDKKFQKGKTISVRFQNQDAKSIVDSFNVVFRPKPIK